MTRTWTAVLTGSLAVLAAVGCCGVDGPRANKAKPRPDDPRLSIEEQQRRGRDKYAIPEDDPRISPPLGIDRPGAVGR